jgi:hypothetical protein
LKTFPEFWTALTENQIWFESLQMRFGRKDIKKCASDAFVYLLADEKLLASGDKVALRKYITSWLMKAPDAPVVPYVPSVEESKKEPENFLVGEERQKRIREVLAEIGKVSTPVPPLSKREIEEEGKWEKKHIPYPSMSPAEVIKHEKHLAWIKANFDPRTGEKLPGFVEEKIWLDSLPETIHKI